MLRRLATLAERRNKTMLFHAWIPRALVVGVGSSLIGDDFRTEFSMPSSESSRAEMRLSSANRSEAGVNSQVVVRAPGTVDDPAVKDAFERSIAAIARIDTLPLTVTSPYEMPNQVSRDRTIAFAQISIPRPSRDCGLGVAAVVTVAPRPLVEAGVQVEYGGVIFQEFELPESEALGLLAAVIILVIAFGTVIAMGLPIGVALLGLLVATGLVTLSSRFMSMPNEATSMVAMIGLGVGIDYALFIVTRFREALHDGLSVDDSVVESIDTSGRAVVFAGVTVMVALLGLLTVGLPFVSGFAVAMTIGVGVMVVASITLLPALLAMTGRRIDETSRAAVATLVSLVLAAMIALLFHVVAVLVAGVVLAIGLQVMRFTVPWLRAPLPHRAQNEHQHTPWWRWSRAVQHHPWRALVVSTIGLGLLAVPMFSLRLGFGDDGNFQKGTDIRDAYDLVSEGFGPGFNGPLYIAVAGDTARDQDALVGFTKVIASTEGVVSAAPVPLGDSDVALVVAYPQGAPQDEVTSDLVHRLREDVIPPTGVDALIGGFTASGIDFSDYIAGRLPFLIGVVLLLSFLLLMAVFRSVLVPAKAVLMNLLSIGSAYGVIVAVFQWGWFADLIGVGKPGPIEAWAPMFLFVIVFGLSMDYEVFLLSRMREEYNRTGDNHTSVADGVAATARVITAAALIMVCVFAAFVLAPDRQLKLFGLGMAVAVFIDATVVRMLLVPATMELLGDRNWWMPKWLARVLPRIDVEGTHHVPSAPPR
ncbi:MAG: MMPL family transporter [Actinomycetota bacterium]